MASSPNKIAETETQPFLPVFSNDLGQEELDAVAEVFASRWLGKGRQCDAFEAEMAATLGTDNFLLTNSGTASIFVAVHSLGLQPGDEVIIASVNFVSCASAVLEVGAVPVFADVDPHTLNILPSEVERLKTDRTRAIIVLHYGGHPCDMAALRAAAGDDILIIEDAAVAFPASIDDQACGTIGDVGLFSFNAVKCLSMGDGGGLTYRDPALLNKAKSLRYLGLADNTRSGLDALTENNPQRWWEFQVDEIAGRHISNDILAAIGRVQLKRLPGFVARRQAVWDLYQELLSDIPGVVTPPEPFEGAKSGLFMYWVQSEDRDALGAYLTANNVYCTFRYFPLHLVEKFGPRINLPGADRANEVTLNIPLHQNMTDDDVVRVADLIRAFHA